MTPLDLIFVLWLVKPIECPTNMVLIDGEYCPVVEQKCINWMEDPVKNKYARCAEFASPSVCKSPRVHMRFCIDKYEHADDNGMPIGDISWTKSAAICKEEGKRLCQESEWTFSCEGEDMLPYPYGYIRDKTICNFDIEHIVENGQLLDLRMPVKSNPKCLSPFGVQNLTGNEDESVVLDKPYWNKQGRKIMSGLKGGYFAPIRARCRPITLDHDEDFSQLQTGFRCCANTILF